MLALVLGACDVADPPPEPPTRGAFDRPQALRFVGDLLVVGNTGYDPDGWRDGSLTIVDPATGEVLHRIPTTWRNPSRLVVHGDLLHVVETGELVVDDPDAPHTTEGGLESIPVARLQGTDRAPDQRSLASLTAPLDLAFVGDVALATSAVRGEVAVITDGLEMHRYAEGLGLGNVVTWRELFLVTDFNTDRLHIFDRDGERWPCAVDLGESARDLEGAQSVAVLGDRLFVVLALSGVVRAVDLTALANVDGCGEPTIETVVAPLGQVPNDLRAHGGRLYVVDSADHHVTAYDPDSGEALQRWSLPPGSNPFHVDLSADGRWMAVTEWAADAVRVFDLAADERTGRRIGGAPDEVAPAPARRSDGVALADVVIDAPTGDGPFRDPRRAVNGVRGAGEFAGGTDVFSLNHDERLVLGWTARRVLDGPGPDLAVFENPFRTGDANWFLDPVVVEVSADGEAWVAFPHDYRAADELAWSDDAADWSGFAGLRPVVLHEELRPHDPFDPAAGGDLFDLADLPPTPATDAIRAEGVAYIRLGAPGTNPDSGEAFPRDPVSNGPDIDGVYARTTTSSE